MFRYRKPRPYRPRRTHGGNFIFDFIKVYIVFLLIVGGTVFLFTSLQGRKIKEKEPSPPSVSLSSVKRSEAFKRGMEIINFTWEFNFERNGVKDNPEIELPSFLKDVQSKKVSGLPYAWGGYITLDTSNQKDVRNFEEAVERGYTTGNVLSEGGYKNFTAGLDCSGFVGAVFELKDKISTRDMEGYFEEIDIKELKPMDIFNCEDYHTMIYLGETPDKKGIITMESTTGTSYATIEKTVIAFRSWEEIKNGDKTKPYTPMRYMKIVDDDFDMFKDEKEFNNYMARATSITIENKIKGNIDFVDDVDYFKFTVNTGEKPLLILSKLPSFGRGEVLSLGGNTILSITKVGNYSLDIPKGTYYIRLYGDDFKYDRDEEYEFIIGK